MTVAIQMILIRQLAGYLSVPLFLVDPKGDLLFYNEPAEVVLGRRFEETGPIPPEELPLMITLAKVFRQQGPEGRQAAPRGRLDPDCRPAGRVPRRRGLLWEIG